MAWRLVELDTIFLEVFQQMKVLARDKIQMRLVDIDQVQVCGDNDRLKQVLVNLIGMRSSILPPGVSWLLAWGLLRNERVCWLPILVPEFLLRICLIYLSGFTVGKNLAPGSVMAKVMDWVCRLRIGLFVTMGD